MSMKTRKSQGMSALHAAESIIEQANKKLNLLGFSAVLSTTGEIFAGKKSELKHEFSMGVAYASAEISQESQVLASELLENLGLCRKKAIEIGVDDFDIQRIDEAKAWPKGDEQ